MTSVFNFFFTQLQGFYDTLGTVTFDVYGINVSLTQILIGFICMGMIISFFWKGARG